MLAAIESRDAAERDKAVLLEKVVVTLDFLVISNSHGDCSQTRRKR
jgi:hypothetical protein